MDIRKFILKLASKALVFKYSASWDEDDIWEDNEEELPDAQLLDQNVGVDPEMENDLAAQWLSEHDTTVQEDPSIESAPEPIIQDPVMFFWERNVQFVNNIVDRISRPYIFQGFSNSLFDAAAEEGIRYALGDPSDRKGRGQAAIDQKITFFRTNPHLLPPELVQHLAAHNISTKPRSQWTTQDRLNPQLRSLYDATRNPNNYINRQLDSHIDLSTRNSVKNDIIDILSQPTMYHMLVAQINNLIQNDNPLLKNYVGYHIKQKVRSAVTKSKGVGSGMSPGSLGLNIDDEGHDLSSMIGEMPAPSSTTGIDTSIERLQFVTDMASQKLKPILDGVLALADDVKENMLDMANRKSGLSDLKKAQLRSRANLMEDLAYLAVNSVSNMLQPSDNEKELRKKLRILNTKFSINVDETDPQNTEFTPERMFTMAPMSEFTTVLEKKVEQYKQPLQDLDIFLSQGLRGREVEEAVLSVAEKYDIDPVDFFSIARIHASLEQQKAKEPGSKQINRIKDKVKISYPQILPAAALAILRSPDKYPLDIRRAFMSLVNPATRFVDPFWRGFGASRNSFLGNWSNAELYQFIVGKKFEQSEAIRDYPETEEPTGYIKDIYPEEQEHYRNLNQQMRDLMAWKRDMLIKTADRLNRIIELHRNIKFASKDTSSIESIVETIVDEALTKYFHIFDLTENAIKYSSNSSCVRQ